MIVLTAALAATGLFQLIFVGRQMATSRAELRAYVFIEDAKITVTEDAGLAKWKAYYIVKNAGSTPAHKVKVLDSLSVENWYPEKLPTPMSDDYLGSVAPNGDFMDCDSDELDTGPSDNSDITGDDGTKAVFLVGRITYIDVFNRAQRTDFCFYWKGRVNPGEAQQMTAYDEGNDST